MEQNKNDAFWVRARRKPQRYQVVSRGFATRPWPKRRVFMFQIEWNTTLAAPVGAVAPWADQQGNVVVAMRVRNAEIELHGVKEGRVGQFGA